MGLLLVLTCAFFAGSFAGCGLGLAGLVVALELLFWPAIESWGVGGRLVVILGLSSIPLAALFAAVLLSANAFGRAQLRLLGTLAICVSFTFFMTFDVFYGGLESYLSVVTQGSFSAAEWLVLFQHFVSRIVLVGSVLAVIYSFATFSFELPFRWMLGVGELELGREGLALRQLLVVAIVSASFQLAGAFVVRELSPERIF